MFTLRGALQPTACCCRNDGALSQKARAAWRVILRLPLWKLTLPEFVAKATILPLVYCLRSLQAEVPELRRLK